MKKNETFPLSLYKKMLKIRLFEEKALELYSKNHIKGSIHLYSGQEAVASGMCSILDVERGDAIPSESKIIKSIIDYIDQ
jgi:pyruvate dehydrogenase E1 component alpha subunit